jgi:hypothetical protein
MECGNTGPCIIAIELQGSASSEVITASGSHSWFIRSLPIPSVAKIVIER